ncbi:MAG TPA: crosslink repair DNA glycosylase YcaQ family protein, partial [Myxococcaceae bacterium]|nr:crosslink repair DNA glycosylase YcaQ family protein [Myxococcaceae bacterium]
MPRPTVPTPATLPLDEARARLVSHLGLAAPAYPAGARGVRELLRRLRHVQLDPLDVIGTNADLVALARVDGIGRGDVYRHLYPGHAFEHWAKERCLLPPSAFPHYRAQPKETPWWGLATRLERLPEGVLRKVLDEVRERGPVTAAGLADHGAVKPMDWSGWKGTGRATSMALEVLWTRCEVVVCGRGPGGKLYDVPERALPEASRARVAEPGEEGFARWAITERAEAAGLLSRAAGAHWSVLGPARSAGVPDALLR